MSNDTSTIRLRAGASAILVFVAAVLLIGATVRVGGEPAALAIERDAVDPVLSKWAANSTVLIISFWVIVILSILVSIFGIELYRILADGQSGLLFAPVALIGGAGLFILEALMMIGVIQGIAPVYAGATGAEQSAIEGTTLALFRFRNRMAALAGIFFALAAIIFGRQMHRSAEFPGWMSYLGYAAGVIGVIGGFFPLFAPLFSVRSIGQVLFFLWVLIAGIILLRNR